MVPRGSAGSSQEPHSARAGLDIRVGRHEKCIEAHEGAPNAGNIRFQSAGDRVCAARRGLQGFMEELACDNS